MLPLCTIASETAHLAVGRGVAIVTIEARVRGRPGGCSVDAGAVLRAREEGRAPPELIAFRTDVDGHPAGIGGPHGRPIVDVGAAPVTVRFVAVLRGDRFAAVPLSADPSLVLAPVTFRATTESVWGPHRIAGLARWTETGAPVVVTVDPTRDHELPTVAARIERGSPIPTIVVDAGPILGGEPNLGTEEARTAALARGGVDAVSVLIGDLPLAIATASDAPSALARLREHARAARAATLASDPLLTALGQRMATAIARGFTTCARANSTELPPRWPAPLRELVVTGLLDDAESGCPRIADLLSVNHPDVRFGQEGNAALADAAAAPISRLPRTGPLERRSPHVSPAHRRGRPIAFAALAAVLALVVASLALSRPGRSR